MECGGRVRLVELPVVVGVDWTGERMIEKEKVRGPEELVGGERVVWDWNDSP